MCISSWCSIDQWYLTDISSSLPSLTLNSKTSWSFFLLVMIKGEFLDFSLKPNLPVNSWCNTAFCRGSFCGTLYCSWVSKMQIRGLLLLIWIYNIIFQGAFQNVDCFFLISTLTPNFSGYVVYWALFRSSI